MKKLDDLIDVFAKLPGIGRKSAQRIAQIGYILHPILPLLL